MKKAIWISYDLGVEGDYSGMYKWLDSNKAIECGDSLAFIKKEMQNDSLVEEIKKEIKENVSLKKSDRVYIIYRDSRNNSVKGEFIFGKRKRSPWEGFSSETEGQDLIDDAE
jgi:hypothetical protein